MFWGESSIWFEDLGFGLLSQLFLGLWGSCLGFYVGVLYQFLGLGFGRVKQFVYAAKRTERAVKLSSFLSVAVQGKCNESLLSNCRVPPILCKDSANRMQ